MTGGFWPVWAKNGQEGVGNGGEREQSRSILDREKIIRITDTEINKCKDSKIEGLGVRELAQFVFTLGDVTQPDK